MIVVLVDEVFAEVMTGLFCRPFEPVSTSPGSLAVLPAASSKPPSRSMPIPALEKMELREISLPEPEADVTPSSPLKAMVLDPAEVPSPTKLFAAYPWIDTPSRALARAPVPLAVVPTRLPSTSFASVGAPDVRTPFCLRCRRLEEVRCRRLPSPFRPAAHGVSLDGAAGYDDSRLAA